MVFLGADLKRIIQRLREESPANTKAETRHLRQYSDWNGCGQLHFIPRGACTAEASSDFLLHIEFSGILLVPGCQSPSRRSHPTHAWWSRV